MLSQNLHAHTPHTTLAECRVRPVRSMNATMTQLVARTTCVYGTLPARTIPPSCHSDRCSVSARISAHSAGADHPEPSSQGVGAGSSRGQKGPSQGETRAFVW